MRYNLAAGAIMAASISGAVAKLSERGATEQDGNWYGQAVDKIMYSGFGKAGSYSKVTNMYPSCQTSNYDYSGPLSPFDEEVSAHFRGPIQLKQFAVYAPSSSSNKPKPRSVHERRHGHAGFHKRNKEIREIQERAEAEERGIGDLVTATIDGKVVHWINQYGGPGAAAASTPAPVSAAAVENKGYIGGGKAAASATAAASEATQSTYTPSKPAAAGDWERLAYYDQDSQTSEGCTFLNNMGGQGSGVFDGQYGNSLSYASADGQSGASSPQTSNGTLGSNQEFIIFSDKECSGDSCGYCRKGSVCYHGFDGPEKAFYFEFTMPSDGTTGFNADMPSVWMLNAQIPRTAQYSSCSCWGNTGGCGEFDVCEVLNSGNDKCKSTWHGNTPGGSSDYFDRPTTSSMKLAVVMANNQINIQKLDDSTEFGTSLSKSSINSICSDSQASDILTSLFNLIS